MKVDLLYFAILGDQAGKTAETLEVSATGLQELWDLVSERYGFTLERTQVKAAVNHEFSPWETGLSEGDLVVFVPPVSGG